MKIIFGGHAAELLPAGAVWFPALGLLAAADLHFEKGSFFARFATLLPPYDSAETLQRLTVLIERYRPRRFVAAGDSFHDRDAALRLPPAELQQLNALIAGVADWHWIAGNHDPALAEVVAGHRAAELTVDGLVFRHQTDGATAHEISGHYHPKTRLSLRGHRLGGPCFVQNGQRLLLPAFGAYTGGLDIDSDILRKIVSPKDREVFLIHGERVFALRKE